MDAAPPLNPSPAGEPDPDAARTPATGVAAGDPGDPDRHARRARREQWRAVLSARLLTTFALVLTVVTAAVFALAGMFIRHTTQVALEEQLGRHLEAVARVAAARLNDPTYLAAARRSRDRRAHFDGLARALQQQAGVSEVVLFTCSGDRAAPEVEVLAAAHAGPGPDRDRLAGRLLADGVAIERARALGAPASSSLYAERLDAEATWRKSAYMPIRDAAGQELAVVGVELPVDFRAEVEAVLWQILVLGTAAGAAVLFVAVFIVRQRVHNPIYRLVRAMQGEGGQGGAPKRAKVRWNDEIGVLTECYNAMVDRLADKDRELRDLYAQAQRTASYLQGYSNSLVAGVPSGVVATDPQGNVTVWNASAARILERAAPLGRPAAEALGAEHPLARALARALQGSVTDQAIVILDPPAAAEGRPAEGKPAEGKPAEGKPAEGKEDEPDEERQRMVELTCAPFHGERGELLGAAALVTDRTELERFRRSASRNERLAAIGTLGAGLAHEIKNPLGAISGFAELIERKEGQDAARLAGRLRREVEELNRFLGEFLSFARDDTLRREPHDLRDLVRRGVEVALQAAGLDPQATAAVLAGAEVRLPASGTGRFSPQGPEGTGASARPGPPLRVRLQLAELPPQAVDGPLLRATFANLAKNAVQAMAGTGRGGELTVRLSRLDDVVYIRFRDQGPGIPLDLRERIFDPLFTTRAEGTGLGLAIVHKTVTAHGGKIAVRDAPGGGAELVLRLPCVGCAGELAQVGAEPAAGRGEEDTSTWRAS